MILCCDDDCVCSVFYFHDGVSIVFLCCIDGASSVLSVSIVCYDGVKNVCMLCLWCKQCFCVVTMMPVVFL